MGDKVAKCMVKKMPTKGAVAEPAPAPVRTAEEQALVDAWQSPPRLQRSPRLKEGAAPGTIVPDTEDVPLWSARRDELIAELQRRIQELEQPSKARQL